MPPTIAPPAATPRSTPAPAIELGEWTPVVLTAEHLASASDVLLGGPTVAVSGAANVDDEAWTGAVWLEGAAGTWSAVAGPDGWRNVYLTDLAASRDGYLAAGTRVIDSVEDPAAGLQVQIEGSIWGSPDLQQWTEIAQLPGADPQWAVVGDGGWVLAGGYAPDGATGCWHGCASGVGLWWSGDGNHWEPAVLEPDPSYRLAGLAYEVDTGFIALARLGFEDERGVVAMWRSVDGRTWARGDDPVGLEGVPVTGLTVEPYGGFVAVAEDADMTSTVRSTVFTSSDGIRWWPKAGGTPNLSGIAPLVEGFIGWQNVIMDPAYGVWTSLDLATWTQVAAYPEFYAERIAGGTRAYSTAGPTQGASLWIAPVTLAE